MKQLLLQELNTIADKLKADNAQNVVCLFRIYEHFNCDLEQVLAFYNADNKQVLRGANYKVYGGIYPDFAQLVDLEEIRAMYEAKGFNMIVINAL